MKAPDQRGFGLLLMIILIAVSAILVSSITIFLVNASNYSTIRLQKMRAHYAAKAGVMKALYDWTTSYDLDDTTGAYATASFSNGNDLIDLDFDSNYAYFMSDAPIYNAQWWPLSNPPVPNPPSPVSLTTPPNSFCTSVAWTSGNSRLYGWTLQNVHSNTGNAANDNLILTGATVRCTGAAGSLNQIRLSTSSLSAGGTQQFSGAASSGAFITFTGAAATRTLTPGANFTGPCTYIQWSGVMSSPAKVTIQFRFSDGSNSHEVLFWNGLLAGYGRPHAHTLSITSRGTSGGAVPQRKRLRAAVATGVPEEAPHQMRILSWEDLGT